MGHFLLVINKIHAYTALQIDSGLSKVSIYLPSVFFLIYKDFQLENGNEPTQKYY